MKISRFAIGALVSIGVMALAAGCGDDETTPTDTGSQVTVYGSYEVQSVSPLAGGGETAGGGSGGIGTLASIGSNAKILHFNTDHSFYILEATAHGFRSMQSGSFMANATQIDLEDRIYTYEVNGDDLTLRRADEVIQAVRATDAIAPDVWIQALRVVATGASPIDAATDLTWDGTTLWCGNAYSSDYIYRISTNSLSAVDSLQVQNSAWGIAWDGTTLWTSSNGSDNIYKLNMATGTNVFTSTAMGAWIGGIARDGAILWCLSNNERTLYQYSTASDNVLSTIDVSDASYGFDGLELVNGFLYMCIGGVVHKCTLSPFEVVDTYQITGTEIEGIGYDGSAFYVMGRDDSEVTIDRVEFP